MNYWLILNFQQLFLDPQNIYQQLKKPLPWNYWQIRDTRTLFDIGIDPNMPKENKHDALQDAIRQAAGVQNVYAKLNLDG
jgi:hypothetical protein